MNQTDTSLQKQKFAFIVMGLSAAALLLGIIARQPILDTFSFGTWLGFAAFLLSLGTVNDRGSNFYAQIAFLASFASMACSVFLSAV